MQNAAAGINVSHGVSTEKENCLAVRQPFGLWQEILQEIHHRGRSHPHGAIVRALNRFHVEDESTYLTLMKATIGEAIGINGGSEEIDLLTRRIDALNKRMLDLVNETVAAGKDVESSEDEFKGISDQIAALDRRIVAIQGEHPQGRLPAGASGRNSEHHCKTQRQRNAV